MTSDQLDVPHERTQSTIRVDDVSAFIRSYRKAPGGTVLEPKIRSSFGDFLMPSSSLRDAVSRALKNGAALSIRADADAAPLLLGMPWEVAAHPDPSRTVLAGTIAGEPVQRVIASSVAHATPNEQRPRACALAYVAPAQVTGGVDFLFDLERVLRARIGFLDSTFVADPDTPASLSVFAARAQQVKPDLIVIVTHGRIEEDRADLQFDDWYPMTTVAAEVLQHVPALMLLIACDEAVLPDVPGAESGASTLIHSGVPYVIAMQSSVQSLLAADFAGTFIDHFFECGSVPHAAAAGRRRMAPTKDVQEHSIDWSFPTVVTCDNGAEQARSLTSAMDVFVRTLELLTRRVPAPRHLYVPRPSVETAIQNILDADSAGLHVIDGAPETGTTEVLRHVVTETLLRAIDLRTTTVRPIVYIDLETYPDRLDDVSAIGDLLASQVTSVRLPGLTPMLAMPPARWRDGKLTEQQSYDEMIALLDANRCVVVLDNVHEKTEAIEQFADAARRMRSSALILATWTGLYGTANIPVPPMTPAETAELARVVDPACDVDAIYASTNGLPGAIVAQGSIGEIVRNLMGLLTETEAALFDRLLMLPHGVSAPIAWEFLARWTEVGVLERKGLLQRRYIEGHRRDYVMVVPASFRAAALATADSAHEENEDDFADEVGEKIFFDTDPGRRLREIAAASEGVGFLIDFQALLVRRDRITEAVVLATLLHEWLFERGRWRAAHVLWSQPLKAARFQKAHYWLRIAKASHVLGLFGDALDQIAEAESLPMTAVDQFDAAMLRALILKDSGETHRAREAVELYNRALEIHATIEPGKDLTVQDIEERRALLHYNRSLLRRYWLRDVNGALDDLAKARELYEQYGNKVMFALTLTERADVQLAGERRDSLPDILDFLHQADRLFEAAANSGDRAFCNYQMARAYLRLPVEPQNQRKALDAVRNAERLAAEAGDVRQMTIAALRGASLSRAIGEITPAAMFAEIRSTLRISKVFAKDLWFRRAARDSLLGCVTVLKDSAERCDAARWAWDAVANWPHYSPRVDIGPAALAFVHCFECVSEHDGALAAEQLVRAAADDLNRILGRTANPLEVAAWLPELKRLATAMGGLWHG